VSTGSIGSRRKSAMRRGAPMAAFVQCRGDAAWTSADGGPPAHQEVSMKRFLLAVSFALLAPACAGEVDDTAGPAAAAPSEDTAAPASPAGRIEPSTLPITQCLNNCQTQYNACFERAQGDGLSECLCDNHLQLCKLSCGGHGITHGC
jgi:hypothetical protein